MGLRLHLTLHKTATEKQSLKSIQGKEEVDYDFKHDILFFKTKDRKYAKSIELLDSIVVDVDKEGFLVGIQIFDASEFLNLDKKELLSIPKWLFNASVYDGNKIDIWLVFQIKVRNKIVEKNPIIAQQINQKLPNSEMVCEAAV